MTYEKRADMRYKIDKIMFDSMYYGGSREDIPEDLFWIWYDTDEAETVEARDEAYNIINDYFIANNIF